MNRERREGMVGKEKENPDDSLEFLLHRLAEVDDNINIP
jgi:hypothetical protein